MKNSNHHFYRCRDHHGFTLLEMLTVLLIVGILLASFTAFFKNYQAEQDRKITKANVKEALVAIENFRALNGRYPRPARLQADSSDPASTGTEQSIEVVGAQTAAGECKQDAGGKTLYCVQESSAARVTEMNTHKPSASLPDTDGRVLIGAIPYRSVNLTESKTFDGYGSRLYYAVTEDLTEVSSFYNLNGAIKLVDAAGSTLTAPDEAGRYVIFSVGKNRVGGWNRNGFIFASCDPDDYTGADRQNCDFMDKTLYSEAAGITAATFRIASTSNGGGANTEDDVVMFDHDLGSQDTGEWRRGLATEGAASADIVMPFRRVLVGSNTGKATAALHIQGTGDLRVGTGGRIMADRFCDTDDTTNSCLKVSQLVRTCPTGEYMVGFGRVPRTGGQTTGTYQQSNGQDTLVLCEKKTIGCPATGNVIFQGIGPDGKAVCVVDTVAANNNAAAAQNAANAAIAAANSGNVVTAAQQILVAAQAAQAVVAAAAANPGNAALQTAAQNALAQVSNAAAAVSTAVANAATANPSTAATTAANAAAAAATAAANAAANPGNIGSASSAVTAANTAANATNAAFGNNGGTNGGGTNGGGTNGGGTNGGGTNGGGTNGGGTNGGGTDGGGTNGGGTDGGGTNGGGTNGGGTDGGGTNGGGTDGGGTNGGGTNGGGTNGGGTNGGSTPSQTCTTGEVTIGDPLSCSDVFSDTKLKNFDPPGVQRKIRKETVKNCTTNEDVFNRYLHETTLAPVSELVACCNKPDVTYGYRVITCTDSSNCSVQQYSNTVNYSNNDPVISGQDTSTPTDSASLWNIFKRNFNATDSGGCGSYALSGRLVQRATISNCSVTWKTIASYTPPSSALQQSACTCSQTNICKTNKLDMPAGTTPTIVAATAGSDLAVNEKKSCRTINSGGPGEWRTSTCRTVTSGSPALVPSGATDGIARCETLGVPTAHTDGTCVRETFTWKKGPYATGQTYGTTAPGTVAPSSCTYADYAAGTKIACSALEGGVYVGYRECTCEPSGQNCSGFTSTTCPW